MLIVIITTSIIMLEDNANASCFVKDYFEAITYIFVVVEFGWNHVIDVPGVLN
jgi:hypothetical protein